VARDLLGHALVRRTDAGVLRGVIVETEAYVGPEDLACHARFGATARTEVMFGPGGVAYVYLCYGIHELFNVVTGPAGHGQAVLIRAIAPHAGLGDDVTVGRGPGKLTRALGIDRRHNRRDLARGNLYIAAPPAAADEIAIGPRIGVDYAGAWADEPLRFWWRDHPAVSRPLSSASRAADRRGAAAGGRGGPRARRGRATSRAGSESAGRR
jgi:DNA-3-methyladenine glycosylase